jgi:rubrerythrin
MNALQYATEMESEGILYYESQAALFQNTNLERIFSILAEEERKHQKILQSFGQDTVSELPQNSNLIHETNLFFGMEKFADEIRANPPQVAVYEMALTIEEKSVRFYENQMDKSSDEHERKVFSFLLSQEIIHVEILEELVTRIRRIDEWVESAEFGNREEY